MKIHAKLIIPFLVFAIAAVSFGAAFAASGTPEAENLEIETYRGVSVSGKLSAADPDGSITGYELTTPPVKGQVEINADGSFVYTPNEGKKGKDYFGYKAIDDEGNYSHEATVIIKITKQKTDVYYSDTDGLPCEYAAVMLAEKNVYIGECVAGEYIFSPDEPITREEFLAMCMKAAGKEILNVVRTTGFADNDAIAAWAKPYVSTALMNGIISGYYDKETGVLFDPDGWINSAEAAVMLDRCFELSEAVAKWYTAEETVPVWAVQSAANISSLGMMPVDLSFGESILTRAEAAVMLAAAIEHIEK